MITVDDERAYHGGAFFEAIGNCFDDLERKNTIINADVLDAWFDPAPQVVQQVTQFFPWQMKTSPPTHAEGVISKLAEARGIPENNFVVGAGSSDLMFRAIRQWVTKSSRVLILNPSYGEYAHLLSTVIGCDITYFNLSVENNFIYNHAALAAALATGYDWVFLVNPNSPTGSFLEQDEFVNLLAHRHPKTRIWIDETYIDYINPAMSLEKYAARSQHVIVCKSLSKCYALSGLRAAYLCGPAHMIKEIRRITPPWVLGLPTQVAVINALQSSAYYLKKWSLTELLRHQLTEAVKQISFKVLSSQANFMLCRIPFEIITAEDFISRCRNKNLYLRNLTSLGSQLDPYTFRLSVKDEDTNKRIITILSQVLHECVHRETMRAPYLDFSPKHHSA